MDKYVGFAKEHGSRTQYKRALELIVPTSSLFDYLEGRVPSPAYTYAKIVEIVEAEEKGRINKAIGEKRTRLGAKIGQVTAEVKREVFEGSELEFLYGCIIDWTNDDDVRRQYEEKILQRAYDTLVVLPKQHKADKRAQVQKLAEGLVILKHPFHLAWQVVLEWKDAETVEEFDVGILREYVEHFREDGLSKVLKGYLDSDISPFPKLQRSADEQDSQEKAEATLAAEDRLLLMAEGLEESGFSFLSHRFMGDYFLHLEEYSSAVDAAKKGRDLLATASEVSGLIFQNNLDALNIILGTALVRFQTPRYHSEARLLFEAILQRKPADTAALIGVGLILEEEEEYTDAVDFLRKALAFTPDIKIQAEAAWCTALSGNYVSGLDDLEKCLAQLDQSDTPSREVKSQILYRIGVCIWSLDPSKAARKHRDGAYSRFLSSLQSNMNYAPPYTSLGIYYADYAKDKKRARKCFQKAFELSPSEVEAAERLAKSFADRGEWDLVEVVAQRVIDSGKVRASPGSKKKAISWPYAALGVVQLNNQDYARSIVSFQSALRISPHDFHCWIGLGESYHNSGRYIAATKAFEQTQKPELKADNLNADDIWFSTYMLANVKRELGEFEQAIAGYNVVLQSKPGEFGVIIALLQALVESAWRSIQLGFFGRAASNATEAIKVAKSALELRADAFNLWKAVGDACSIFSCMQVGAADLPFAELHPILTAHKDLELYDLLADLDGIGQNALRKLLEWKESSAPPELCFIAAVLFHKRAVHVCANDVHAQAVAFYNLGWTEYRVHSCMSSESILIPKKAMGTLKASVRCFKRAIELEASNSEFWNALGVVTTGMSPKVSQHAFIRSLYLNDKSARVWTNLGTLYLSQNDHQLANDAFGRAQSADPDYAHAWVGQGLLALLIGEAKEAESLFTHAFEIADASSAITKQQYSLSMFDHLLRSPASSTQATDVLQPLHALRQHNSQPNDHLSFEHLRALFAERIGDQEAISILSIVCDVEEANYEETEAPISLARFAQAKADLARSQLAAGEYAAAAESAEMALDLSSDEEIGVPDPAAREKYRLSAHMTAGRAYYFLGSMDQSIEMFRTALEETDGSPDVICLLAQVLWAKSGEAERDVARKQLFDCVEKHPSHFGAISLISAIAVLDNDEATIEAVAADLEGLRADSSIDRSQQRKIGEILSAIATSKVGPDKYNAEISDATTAVMLAPTQPHGWSQLAQLTEETEAADMALLTALDAVPPKGTLDAEDLCKAWIGTGRIDDAQRAIVVAPWLPQAWDSLL